MDIINTFISDWEKIPEYTLYSLIHLRELNPNANIYFVCNSVHPYDRFFKRHNITHINQSEIKSDLMSEFNDLSWLKKWGTPDTKHPSPNYFFHRAMERIYYIEAVMDKLEITKTFHCENDVVTYISLDEIESYFDSACWAVPSTRDAMTAAVLITGKYALTESCKKMNQLLFSGEDELLSKLRIDMVNEMALLHACGNINKLPIHPDENNRIVFDPSSYGQYVAGTNNHNNGLGFTDMTHLLGPGLRSGELKVHYDFENGVAPTVNGVPLFNLHIHSKNLKDFSLWKS